MIITSVKFQLELLSAKFLPIVCSYLRNSSLMIHFNLFRIDLRNLSNVSNYTDIA